MSPALTTVGIKAQLVADIAEAALGPLATHLIPDGRIVTMFHTESIQIRLEGLQRDGLTWSDCEDIDGTNISDNAATDPTTGFSISSDGVNVRLINNHGADTYEYKYWYWRLA